MLSEPLVSIGVPVYNDAPWLRNALERLLNQDYHHLEIILADDGSTDGSRAICREYARRDARIRLFENKYNLKALGNHKFVFDVSTGDYFAWGSGHDYYHSSFISKTLANLQANPSVIMCCSQSVFITEQGEVRRTTKGGLDTRGLPPAQRFRKLLEHTASGGTANIIYGLYRHEALGQKSFFREVSGWDIIMLGELSLLGEMTQVDEVLHYRLLNHAESGQEHSARHTGMLFADSGFLPKKVLYYLASSGEFLNMVVHSQLSVPEKQKLSEDIFELDVDKGRSAISSEIDRLLAYARTELQTLEPYPQVRRYRAMQILNVLEQARALGFYSDDIPAIRSMCLSSLNAGREAGPVTHWKKPLHSVTPPQQGSQNGQDTLLHRTVRRVRKALHKLGSRFARRGQEDRR